MKMHADRPEGANAISRHAPEGVIIAGVAYRDSVLVPWQGAVQPWAVQRFESLSEQSFEPVIALAPELVLFGSGGRLRFPPPAVLRALMARRIGFEAMDTPAACRTYNVLLAEGRAVVAALLFETRA
ncbi:Mth938-like domain-containing protein [Piscinibacter sp.]|uniref:Mth938-like domain-containing protein n=1 Tax=Piscinibacter sp. TaxID=1903157 RepID=UPI0039E57D9C